MLKLSFLWLFLASLALSVPVFLWMAKGIFAPLERMNDTMRRVGQGDLSARNNHRGSRDEIGLVALDVAGEERQKFITQAETDYTDFAVIASASWEIDDSHLVLKIPLQAGD